MSTKKTYYITGPCKWAKLITPDEYKGEKKWTINVYLNKETKKQVKDTGVAFKIREDEDGEYVIFTRSMEKLFKKDGKNEVVEFGPPELFDKDLNKLDCLIGNGSIVTAKINVFNDTAHRLEAVRVDNLVKYKQSTEEKEGPF